jgi:hypothetical protein
MGLATRTGELGFKPPGIGCKGLLGLRAFGGSFVPLAIRVFPRPTLLIIVFNSLTFKLSLRLHGEIIYVVLPT